MATGRIARSGNPTFRVILPPEGSWHQLMAELEPLACWFDVRTPSYLAISVPAAQAEALAAELQRREAAGELQYENGNR